MTLANIDIAPKTDEELSHLKHLHERFRTDEDIIEYSDFGIWLEMKSKLCLGYTSYVDHLIWALQTVEQIPLPNKDDEVPLESGKTLWGISKYVRWSLQPTHGHQVDAEYINVDDEAIWVNFNKWVDETIDYWNIWLEVMCPICSHQSLLMMDGDEILDVDDCSQIKPKRFECPECYSSTNYSPLLGNIFAKIWEEPALDLVVDMDVKETLPKSPIEKLNRIKEFLKGLE